MKITKFEKIWLVLTVIFYILYNLPGVPKYGDGNGTIIHALLTVLPIWILGYYGMYKINRIYELREDPDEEEKGEK